MANRLASAQLAERVDHLAAARGGPVGTDEQRDTDAPRSTATMKFRDSVAVSARGLSRSSRRQRTHPTAGVVGEPVLLARRHVSPGLLCHATRAV